MQARSMWIAVCALAVLGGFLLALQLLWMLGIGYDHDVVWLPYAAHGLGGLAAGASMALTVSPGKRVDAAIGALAAIAALVVINVASTRAFGWTPMRHQPWLMVPLAAAIAAGSAFAGVHLVARPARAGAAATSMLVFAACFLFGMRIISLALDVTSVGTATIVLLLVSFAAAALVQGILPSASVGAITAGAAAYVGYQLLFGVARAAMHVTNTTLLLAIPILGAVLGARYSVQRRKL